MRGDPAAEAPARPPLDGRRLRASVSGVAPPYRLSVVERATSTNALLAELARDGAPDRTVLVAEHQTAGRGRLDRTWESPPRAGLTFSVLLRPDLSPEAWPWLPLLTGYAVGRALRALGVAARLKWPNDVLIDTRKVAGVLVERIDTRDGTAAVLGVGVNVTTALAELPDPRATSLWLETGSPVDRTGLLGGLLVAVAEEYAAWRDPGGASGLHRAYTAASATLHRAVAVHLPGGGTVTGWAERVDGGGRLVVRTGTGWTAVGAGDVVHVRPDGG